ncbi:MAG: Cna B-type domain-containing protein [Erysipelotrichaceae bacterium]|nr:Cna B-type domain-containing protein [Erysipelotrichaceae bacterium]
MKNLILKKNSRIIQYLMILCFLLSQFQVLSAASIRNVEIETRGGVYENVAAEAESETQDGVTVTTAAAVSYQTESGMTVDYDGVEKDYGNGRVELNEHYTAKDNDSGYEAEGWHEKSVELFPCDMPIELTISSPQAGMVYYYGEESGSSITEGDSKTSDYDGRYDYSVTEVETQGKTGIRTAYVFIGDAHVDFSDEVMDYVHNDTLANEENDMITNQDPVVIPPTVEVKDGYGYQYIASDQYSTFFPAWDLSSPMASYPDEEPVYVDEQSGLTLYAGGNHEALRRRKLVVPKLYLQDKTVEGAFYARWSTIEQFTLSDVNGQKISAYCADLDTPAEEGYCYKISNLEDADYYSEDEAAMIRAIAGYGYWGSSDGYGSLDTFKAHLLASGEFTQDEIDRITDGVALTAMQQSIWHFSNSMSGYVFVNAYKTNSPYIGTVNAEMDQDLAALIYKLYYHLIDLDPSYIAEEDKTTENTIINEENFLDRVSLMIKEKAAGHGNNIDSDEKNDAYLADFAFSLKVQPKSENGDSLTLTVYDENGDPIVIGRIAGELQEGEIQAERNGNGDYVLKNIPLLEGDRSLSFALSGIQNLAHDVYMLKSEEVDSETSQTMICVARGSHRVNIRLDIGFELDVEDERRVVEHFRRIENDPKKETIEIKKVWNDLGNQAGARPESVTIHLWADGEEIASVELSDRNGWERVFEDLPKYDGEKQIEYSLSEDPVPGYETQIYGYTVVNRYKNAPKIPVTGID